MDAIVLAVAGPSGYTLADIYDGGRLRSIVRVRGDAMLLARERLGLSYPELGRFFGRDQSTCRTLVLAAGARREAEAR